MTIEFKYTGEELYARMERAVERVTDRLRKTVRILESAGILHAVVGGHAVRAWVAQVDEAAVRNTRDVDILLRAEDLQAATKAMKEAGFHYRQTSGVDMFVEEPDASARDAVHIVLAGQMVRPDDFEANPEPEPLETADGFNTIPLRALVRMKLNSFRRKDQVHLLDMISLDMIDETWIETLPDELGRRLKLLLDDPDG